MTLNANLDYELSLRDEKKSFMICEEHSIFCWKRGGTLPTFLMIIQVNKFSY
jgi:hypothetical protein